ncbi:helix-turn-helix transcriptional regulator, LysR family [Syntrophotalea carbinolica DSM 2380]|uniref:Helix-turn-helix transcriptional regulator, LysR family n=1 Tax=Syntrophotalea carbinolica (strain DSM 2380 / NBRC 103641 / GraBd1) TaxID=338963 RepID=Q3A6B9_SYNC1|nr:selenium metabolism-associated LysR family transcriptional regulator [Syntrophotalea carbinolica]ABA88088.1 helix-turn-helix transcriptional regulator, LysR family [Syntrophotalea carbinolica DSM 2380]
MNLKQLEVFIAVAESGSFSRAAEITFLTQSTVSQHVSSLEKEFELKLLDRTGKGAFLTEAGTLLLDHAQRVVAEAREVPRALSRFRGLEDVTLKIGGSNIPACYMIPQCIFAFRRQHPGVIITLCQGDSRETLERVKREEVAFALVGTRFADKGLVHTPLVLDKISLVVPAGHPWSKKQHIRLADLAGEPIIVREPGSGTDRTLREALAKAGFAPDELTPSMCLGSNEAVKQAILNGAGISFVSEMSVQKECERGELSMVEVQGLEILRHFYLIARQGRDLAPAAKAFIDCIHQRFRL